MGSHIVYWDSGTNDGVIHESPSCPELRHAISIHRGTQEEARQTGRVKQCPYCRSEPSVRDGAEPPTMRRSYSILLALLAACCVWIGCVSYYDGIADTAYGSDYAAAQADAETTASEQYRAGYDAGKKSGYDYGQKEGYNSGYTEGYSAGKSTANSYVDYNRGYNTGYKVGVAEGKKSVDTSAAYNNGYSQGYSNGATSAGQSYQSEQTTSYTVYITATGSKYHSYGCSYLRDSCYSIDINDAIAQGYTACSRCNP